LASSALAALAALAPITALETPPAALAVLALAAPRPAAAEVLNRVVLRVNDQIATLYEFQRRRDETVREIVQRVQDPAERQQALGQVSENVFRDMFQELLLGSRADQLAVEATDQEVDAKVAEMRQAFGIKTDEEFQSALRQSNMTLEGLRAQTRRNLRIHEVMAREVYGKIKIKDEDLRKIYRQRQAEFTVPEQVQLREVVVLEDSGLPEAERMRLAAAIRGGVAAGKSLADAAAAAGGADPGNKGQISSVVEIGWVSPKDLDPKLEAAAWKLPKNGITDPVPARGGLHLVQLIDRRPQHVRPFAEVQQAIQQQEQDRLARADTTKYLADLESRSLVVADPPAEAANFRRQLGGSEDPALQGLAATGAAAGKPASPAAPEGAATPGPGDITGTHPATVDTTTDRKSGGLPAVTPVGAPAKEPVIAAPPASKGPETMTPPATTTPPPVSQPPASPPPANPPSASPPPPPAR